MPEPPALHTRPVPGQKPIKGVFSIDSKHLLGIGGGRQASQRIFFYAEQLDAAGRVALQRLSRNFIPSGTKRFITREILLTQYQPEPSVYLNKVVPVMRRMEEAAKPE